MRQPQLSSARPCATATAATAWPRPRATAAAPPAPAAAPVSTVTKVGEYVTGGKTWEYALFHIAQSYALDYSLFQHRLKTLPAHVLLIAAALQERPQAIVILIFTPGACPARSLLCCGTAAPRPRGGGDAGGCAAA